MGAVYKQENQNNEGTRGSLEDCISEDIQNQSLEAVTGWSAAHSNNTSTVTKDHEDFNWKVTGHTQCLLCCHRKALVEKMY